MKAKLGWIKGNHGDYSRLVEGLEAEEGVREMRANAWISAALLSLVGFVLVVVFMGGIGYSIAAFALFCYIIFNTLDAIEDWDEVRDEVRK